MSQPQTSLAFRAIFHREKPCDLEPVAPSSSGSPGRFRINVLFTNVAQTLDALNAACSITADLDAEIVLLVPLTVPYPRPIDEPDIPLTFLCKQITEMTKALNEHAEVSAYIYIGRDPLEMLLAVLPPSSVICLGTGRRWLFNRNRRMARQLRRSGHEVILTVAKWRSTP
jgi:hypothetical protein